MKEEEKEEKEVRGKKKKKQEKAKERGQRICIRERTDIVFQIGIRGIGLLGSK